MTARKPLVVVNGVSGELATGDALAASTVAITGGTVDGTTVGGTTPAPATVTTLSVTGTATASQGWAAPNGKGLTLTDTSGHAVQWPVLQADNNLVYYGKTSAGAQFVVMSTLLNQSTAQPMSFAVPVSVNLTPQSGWSFDTSGNVQTLASGATIALAAGAGLLILSNGSTDIGVFALGGSIVVLIASTGGNFVSSGTPAAGKIGVAYTNSAYNVISNYGSAVQLGVTLLRTRASN